MDAIPINVPCIKVLLPLAGPHSKNYKHIIPRINTYAPLIALPL
jgi:hypothetical protein